MINKNGSQRLFDTNHDFPASCVPTYWDMDADMFKTTRRRRSWSIGTELSMHACLTASEEVPSKSMKGFVFFFSFVKF